MADMDEGSKALSEFLKKTLWEEISDEKNKDQEKELLKQLDAIKKTKEDEM